jgi:putative transposase
MVDMELAFYGSRRMVDWLGDEGHLVNRKRVQRLMRTIRTMGTMAIYPKKNMSQPNQAHHVYPHLLGNLNIDRSNQVWATDITYLPMAEESAYLAATIDWCSRRVLSWRLSNTLDSQFCVDALEGAIAKRCARDLQHRSG